MKILCYKSLRSVHSKINYYKRKYCFQIFGFDFMLDEFFKVWLIEVNTNPCI
jgi:D-alanine-D-alanine ligase-like ATP-grasp enzyme